MRIGVFATLAFLLTAASVSAALWEELKGDHFIVYHQRAEAFARPVRDKAETYYKRIADELGYARYSNFWQWDNRVKIYLYPTQEDYQKATGEPGWSTGMAHYNKKEIHTFISSDGFLDGLLPHEITHLIFRDFVGFKGQIPLWMDEGVAQWQEPEKRALSRKVSFYLLTQGRHWPLQDLMSADLSKLSQEEIHFFYMQSVTVVDLLVRVYGAGAFTVFCRELRDGKTLEEALRAAYPGKIASLSELEAKWRDDAMKAA